MTIDGRKAEMRPRDAGIETMHAGVGVRDGRVARRDQTRARLVSATVELFAINGYAETSIEEIAERAGVSKGSVFYNFGSKEDLFEEAIRHCARVITRGMLEAKGKTRGGEAVERVIASLFRTAENYRAATQVAASEMIRSGQAWEARTAALRQQIFAPLIGALSEYVGDLTAVGEITRPVPPAMLEGIAASVWGSVVSVSLGGIHAASMDARRHVYQTIITSLAGYRGVDNAAVTFRPSMVARDEPRRATAG